MADRIVVGEFLDHHGTYDAITMRFVLEHLADPTAYLRHARDLLERDGVLFVSVPDYDSPKARRLRDKWVLVNDPTAPVGHVWWHNRRSIDAIADRCGYEVVWAKNRGELYDLPAGLRRLLDRTLGRDGERFIRWYQPRILWASLVDGALSGRVGYGECLYVILRPR